VTGVSGGAGQTGQTNQTAPTGRAGRAAPQRTGSRPAPDAPTIAHRHRDLSGGWLRPTVFGMMDGLVSNFALIVGFAGGRAESRTVVLAGLAGLAAGAFSMASGELVSVQSQNESTRAEVQAERRELTHNAAGELAELTESYVARGVDPDVAATFARQISRNPDQALIVHAQQELGVDPTQLPSPYIAAVSSFLAFCLGAIIPVLPYFFGAATVWISTVLAAVSLFGAGALASRFTSRSWWFAGTRQLAFGMLSAAVTYGVGSLFHVTAN
jgi:VIT1/CCC1 family predicted Fe2+/Mn2+ transporter